jgi:hypothetical protein
MARVEAEPRPSRRRLHPLLHRSGRLADVPGPTEHATEAATATEATASTTPPPGAAPVPPAEARQRWRLTFARDPVDADHVGRAVLDAWQEALAGCGLPVAGLEPGGGGRARIAFAAPLPAAARGEAELVDLWLLERRPLWAVREALAGRLPAAHRWISAEDVWLGEAALAGRVSAADWRIELGGADLDPARIAEAVRSLIAAPSLPRTRRKGATEKTYDLRLLLDGLDVDAASTRPVVLRARTRFHPEHGTGRPEEVVAAIGESVGVAIEIAALSRIRLLLADDPPARARPTGLRRP